MSYKRVIIKEFGGPEVLKVIDESTLPEPKFGEVRIKVLVTSAAFTDTMIRKGQYPDVKKKPPFSPGYDMIGLVDKLGEGVTKFIIGQKVADLTVIGAYSEYICLPESRLTLVPDELEYAEGYKDRMKIVESKMVPMEGAGGNTSSEKKENYEDPD